MRIVWLLFQQGIDVVASAVVIIQLVFGNSQIIETFGAALRTVFVEG